MFSTRDSSASGNPMTQAVKMTRKVLPLLWAGELAARFAPRARMKMRPGGKED